MRIVLLILLPLTGMFVYLFCLPGTISVESGVVKRAPIQKLLPEDGYVRSESEIVISSELALKIERILVKEGDRVNKDDLLIVLQEQRIALELERAQAQLSALEEKVKELKELYADAERDLQRYTKLVREGMVSKEKFQEIQTAFNIAQRKLKLVQAQRKGARAEVEIIKDQLAKTKIRSPIDGVVTFIYKREGELAIPTQPLLRVIDPSSLYIEIEIADSDIAEVREGQTVKVSAEGLLGEFEGKLSQIIPEARLKNTSLLRSTDYERIFRGIVKLQNHPASLRVGMSVYADIVVAEKKDAIVVPRSAIIFEKDKSYVYLVKDGRVYKRLVRLGIKSYTDVEILEGVHPGDRVAISNIDRLSDGVKIDVR
jgi:RND family efflux transporter MFP subunit